MTTIDDEIRAYESRQSELESQHMGQWVLMRDRDVIGVFESFEGASETALERFGRGPYLIRQVGAEPLRLPVSVMYHRYAR